MIVKNKAGFEKSPGSRHRAEMLYLQYDVLPTVPDIIQKWPYRCHDERHKLDIKQGGSHGNREQHGRNANG